MPTKVARMRLKHDGGFAGWARLAGHASNYIYNRAVSEYLFGGDYMDRIVVDVPTDPKHFRLPKKEDGIVSGNLAAVDRHYQAYDFGPSERMMKYGVMKELTVWRGEKDWLRDLPVAYGRGAIIDASVACRRVTSDSSDRPPYRRKDGRIILGSVIPPVRKGDHLMRIPGYGVVETAAPIDPSWDMRSFRIVEVTGKVTRRTTPADRKFELHIAVRVPVEKRRPTGVARGVDVGGHHLVVTAGTNGNVAIHGTAHKRLLREIDALRGLRDRSNKGGRRWSRINKKIRRLLSRVRGLVDDTINQAVARITRGVDTVAIESLSVKGMTARGGNYKRAMNRSVRENRVGEFLAKLSAKCGMRGVDLVEVPAPHTSQMCHLCGHVDAKSRVSRDHFICTKCNREFHADINAAWNILHRAAGKVAQRRPGVSWGDKPKSRALPAIRAAGASRKRIARRTVY